MLVHRLAESSLKQSALFAVQADRRGRTVLFTSSDLRLDQAAPLQPRWYQAPVLPYGSRDVHEHVECISVDYNEL